MEKKIAALAAQLDMLPRDARVLLALSGGMDSMCLAHFLKAQEFKLAAAHFNHHLRGADADADERFVRAWCEENGIACYVGGADVAALAAASGQSVEEAGRAARYAFLEQTAERIGAARIVTAHHALDNAETVLFNLARGAGLDGLSGIPPVRGRLVRPMLAVTREEIEDYAARNAVPYRTDRTNSDTVYTRNFIRREILPKLTQVNSSCAVHLSETALRVREESEFLNALAAERMSGLFCGEREVSLPRETLRDAPGVLRLRMLRLMLDALPVGKKDFTAAHYEALNELAVRETCAQLNLPHGVLAVNEAERFCLRLSGGKCTEMLPISEGMTAHWGEYTISVQKAGKNRLLADDIFYLSYDTIGALRIGAWDAGKRMALPEKQERSLKRLFAEHGISPELRDRLPVVYCGEKAAAVCGIGAAAEFAAAQDADALEIRISKNNNK